MFVLGSGGHTSEILPLISGLSKGRNYGSFICVCTSSDEMSMQNEHIPKETEFVLIPRSRKVGQSYFSSIFTTIYSIFYCFTLIFKKPDLLVVNGPGVCLPVVFNIYLGNIIGITKCHIVFIESFCRVNSLSLTGKLVYPFCDNFYVYWDSLLNKRKGIELLDLFSVNKKHDE